MQSKADIAREYRTKYPDKPSLALARIMYKSNKLLFKDVEGARTSIRYIEGKMGRGNNFNNKVKESEFLKEEARPYNPYKLPESDEAKYEPFVLKGHSKIAILCDIHVPYHNIEAVTKAIEYCKKQKVDGVVINGDLFDFHGGSRFLKDPRKKKMWQEIEIGCEIIRIIYKELKCKIYFKLGNHDERWLHYLFQKLGELDQLSDLEEIKDINLEKVLLKRLPNVPITIIEDKRIIKANELNIVHGHEFGGNVFSPVNIARGFYLRAKANTIGGHHHRTSEHTEININEKITTTWSIGSLCELHPAYLPINSWNHGLAIVELDANKKDFQVHNKRIFKGRVL
jgi:predicted phosphodiesterase